MPITIRRGGAAKPFVPPASVQPVAPPPVARRVPAAPSPAPSRRVEEARTPEPAEVLSPVATEADAAAMRRWRDFPAPGAKAKACAHCGQHYLRPCDDAAKVSCSNYAYARKFGVRQAAS